MRHRIGRKAGRHAQMRANEFSITDQVKASRSSQVVSERAPKLMRKGRRITEKMHALL